LTTVRLDDFGFETQACSLYMERLGVGGNAPPVALPAWFCDGRFTVGLPGQLPRKYDRAQTCRAQHHAALVLPQAWVVLEASPCSLARGISALERWCGQPVTLRLRGIGIAES
jgi:hypothetical protein